MERGRCNRNGKSQEGTYVPHLLSRLFPSSTFVLPFPNIKFFFVKLCMKEDVARAAESLLPLSVACDPTPRCNDARVGAHGSKCFCCTRDFIDTDDRRFMVQALEQSAASSNRAQTRSGCQAHCLKRTTPNNF